MDISKLDAFIFMKVGSHKGESLDCILNRKKRERKCDKKKRIFWGYGGNRLLPERVRCFAKQWDNEECPIQLLMPFTRAEERTRAQRKKKPVSADDHCQLKSPFQKRQYSKDGKTGWKNLPSGVNVPESPYALVLGEINEVRLPIDSRDFIDRRDFKVGAGPSKGDEAAEYGGKYWFDHVCLVKAGETYDGPNGVDDSIVTIAYQASIVEPYAVYLE